MAKILIGTSGWTYSSWKGTFYPIDLPRAQYLKYYCNYFPITEVNYSFYHLPKTTTYQSWHEGVSPSFLFALKASRFITHTKRLQGVDEAWQKFIDHASHLESNIGPILFQMPASFHLDLARLESFLVLVKQHQGNYESLRLVFEFRHQSWFIQDVYDLLSKYGAALCIADSPKYPRHDIITTDFTYIRYHGRQELFASSYSKKELSEEANIINKFIKQELDVYVFFNNDAKGHAIENAQTLQSLV